MEINRKTTALILMWPMALILVGLLDSFLPKPKTDSASFVIKGLIIYFILLDIGFLLNMIFRKRRVVI